MNKKTIITALLALVAMAGQAQEEREYNISGFVPDGIEKAYLYKTEGLGSHVFLDSVTVADGKFGMKGNRPAYDLVSLGNNADQFLNGVNMMATILHVDASRRGQGHDVVDWHRGVPLHRRSR